MYDFIEREKKDALIQRHDSAKLVNQYRHFVNHSLMLDRPEIVSVAFLLDWLQKKK